MYKNLLKNAKMLLMKLARGDFDQKGSSNPNWKGNAAGYSAKHKRVANNTQGKKLGKKCVNCGSTKNLQYATIHGTNGKQHKTLCASCHASYDNKSKNFKK